MSTTILSMMNTLDPNNLDDYHDLKFDLAGRNITVDLNFEKQTIDPTRLEMVKDFLTKLVAIDKLNKDRIRQDYDDETCDTVKIYLQYFMEDNEEEDLKQFASLSDDTHKVEQQLLDKFNLVRVVLYPDDDSHFASFDYTISETLTGDLVVIFTDAAGNMDYVTLES